MELPSKAYDFHLHMREGSIVPLQDLAGISFRTSKDLQAMPINLHILGAPSQTTPANFRAIG